MSDLAVPETSENGVGLFQPAPNYLDLSHVTTEDEWRTVGNSLRSVSDGWQWWGGDWWLHGEDMFGDETVYDFVDSERPADKTFKNAAWVCSVFPAFERREGLSFSHHAAVAADKFTSVRSALLDTAEAEGLSVRDLTVLAKEMIGETGPTSDNDLTDVDVPAEVALAENGLATPADAIHFMLHRTMPDLFGETPAAVVACADSPDELEQLRLKTAELFTYSKDMLAAVMARMNA